MSEQQNISESVSGNPAPGGEEGALEDESVPSSATDLSSSAVGPAVPYSRIYPNLETEKKDEAQYPSGLQSTSSAPQSDVSMGFITNLMERVETSCPGIRRRLTREDFHAIVTTFQNLTNVPLPSVTEVRGLLSSPSGQLSDAHVFVKAVKDSEKEELVDPRRPGSLPKKPFQPSVSSGRGARNIVAPRPARGGRGSAPTRPARGGQETGRYQRKGPGQPVSKPRGQGQTDKQRPALKPKAKTGDTTRSKTVPVASEKEDLCKRIGGKISRSLNAKVSEGKTLASLLPATKDDVMKHLRMKELQELRSWETTVVEGQPPNFLDKSRFLELPKFSKLWRTNVDAKKWKDAFDRQSRLYLSRSKVKSKFRKNYFLLDSTDGTPSTVSEIISRIRSLNTDRMQTILHLPGIPSGALPPEEVHITSGPKQVGSGLWVKGTLGFSEAQFALLQASSYKGAQRPADPEELPLGNPSYVGGRCFRFYLTSTTPEGTDAPRLCIAFNLEGVSKLPPEKAVSPVISFKKDGGAGKVPASPLLKVAAAAGLGAGAIALSAGSRALSRSSSLASLSAVADLFR